MSYELVKQIVEVKKRSAVYRQLQIWAHSKPCILLCVIGCGAIFYGNWINDLRSSPVIGNHVLLVRIHLPVQIVRWSESFKMIPRPCYDNLFLYIKPLAPLNAVATNKSTKSPYICIAQWGDVCRAADEAHNLIRQTVFLTKKINGCLWSCHAHTSEYHYVNVQIQPTSPLSFVTHADVILKKKIMRLSPFFVMLLAPHSPGFTPVCLQDSCKGPPQVQYQNNTLRTGVAVWQPNTKKSSWHSCRIQPIDRW